MNNIDTLLLTKVHSSFGFFFFFLVFTWLPFLFQDPTLNTTLHLLVMCSMVSLDCDSFSNFAYFWWARQFWEALAEYFVGHPSTPSNKIHTNVLTLTHLTWLRYCSPGSFAVTVNLFSIPPHGALCKEVTMHMPHLRIYFNFNGFRNMDVLHCTQPISFSVEMQRVFDF